MKFLINSESGKAVNLNNVAEICVSNNYLVLTTEGGQYAREMRFIYGTEGILNRLFTKVMEFLANDEKTLDCYEFINGLK